MRRTKFRKRRKNSKVLNSFFSDYIDRAPAVLYNSVQTLYWREQLLPPAFKRSAKGRGEKTRRKKQERGNRRNS